MKDRGAKDACTVVLTALPVEYKAVRSHIGNIREVVHEGTVYEVGFFSSQGLTWRVVIADVGVGNQGASFEAERAISKFRPAVILLVGVAGGIKDVGLGDVVAAGDVFGYESGKDELVFKPRASVRNSSHNMVQRAKAVARGEEWRRRIIDPVQGYAPRAFVGPIAAGEKVIASSESAVFKFLRDSYSSTLAVEMEGRGFLQATHANPGVSSLIVRGISDLIENKSDLEDDFRQEVASRHASAFAFEVLSKLDSKTNPLFPKRLREIRGPKNQTQRNTRTSRPSKDKPKSIFEANRRTMSVEIERLTRKGMK
jgi:nucleoside phosphorylase